MCCPKHNTRGNNRSSSDQKTSPGTNMHNIRNMLASSTFQIIIHIPSVPSEGYNVALDVQKAPKQVGAPDLRREQVAKAAR